MSVMSLVAYIEFTCRAEFPESLDSAKLLLSFTSIAINQSRSDLFQYGDGAKVTSFYKSCKHDAVRD